jgi:hypothetical protein
MNLSKKNLDVITQYFLGNTSPMDAMDEDYKNLMLCYATDNNSSTVRELVTLNFLGYEPYFEKHGADGYDPKTNRKIEVKPRYLETGKISSSGNFNDMTMELLESKKDFNIVCSLFAKNKLVYIVEFPIAVIWEKLKKPIVEAKIGKRVVCPFGYNNYDHKDLVIHYYDPDAVLEYNCLSKDHKKLLESKWQKP